MSVAREEQIAHEMAAELVRTRHTVAALGQAIKAAHAPTSPSVARSVQAQQNLYDQIDAEFGLLSSAEAGEMMGSRSAASRNLALAARREGRLLGLQRGRYLLFPGFQFSETGLRPAIGDLIDLGRRHDRSDTGLIQWLMSPTTYLHGKRPVDVIDDPHELLDVASSASGVEW